MEGVGKGLSIPPPRDNGGEGDGLPAAEASHEASASAGVESPFAASQQRGPRRGGGPLSKSVDAIGMMRPKVRGRDLLCMGIHRVVLVLQRQLIPCPFPTYCLITPVNCMG